MAKQIFKEGDRVYHFSHGWATIECLGEIYNGENCYFLKELKGGLFTEKSLSFTEYTLSGFSHERSKSTQLTELTECSKSLSELISEIKKVCRNLR